VGAADYLGKPFHIDELIARVRVALRRSQENTNQRTIGSSIHIGDLSIDLQQRLVMVAGSPVSLSKTEFRLLRVLGQHAGMVMSHDILLERVWGPGYSQEVAFVWVYIRRLRRKLEPDPAHPRYILTVPGVGYRLAKTFA